MTTPANTEHGLRRIWQRLERYASHSPRLAHDGCQECGAAADQALCGRCDARRLELRAKFGTFAPPATTVRTVQELEQLRELACVAVERIRVEARHEWLPYKDWED